MAEEWRELDGGLYRKVGEAYGEEAQVSAASCEVFGVGQCSLDYIGTVESFPDPDSKCALSELIVEGGGPVATALVALARWGVRCAFAGVAGDDPCGVRIKESLEAEGIDIRGMVVRGGEESQVAFIVAEPRAEGRRTVFWRRPTGAALAREEVDYSLVREARVVHTDGFYADASLAVCRAARKVGAGVVVDAGSMREGMLEIARESDYFLASETFARSLVGEGKDLEACHEIAKHGPRLVGVTRGARGYVALVEGVVIDRPAYPVAAMDTTGCGDVFHAGFIYGVVRGWELRRCLEFGSWAAAQVSLRLGGRAGIPRVPREKTDEG
jgi:sulfofructose kinase